MGEQHETGDGPETETETDTRADVPQDEIDDIESERDQRLDPGNRPDNVEVDNTPRTFDPGAGMFTDNPDYDPKDRPFAGEDDAAPPPSDPPSDSETTDDTA